MNWEQQGYKERLMEEEQLQQDFDSIYEDNDEWSLDDFD